MERTTGGLSRILRAILGLGMAGTAAELLLIEHHEDAPQLIPLLALGLAFAVLAWHVIDGRRASLRMLQATMVILIVAGVAGIVLHYRATQDFQLEVDASLSGRELFWRVMQAKSPPTLAPGLLVQLGLLGLASTYGDNLGRTR